MKKIKINKPATKLAQPTKVGWVDGDDDIIISEITEDYISNIESINCAYHTADNKMTIKEINSREVLSEGRNNGIGFAFLKREEENYNTAHAFSPCKDYLNDVVFTENTGYPLTAYGLYYSKNSIFEDMAYMTIKIVTSKGGAYTYSKSMDADIELLKKNHKNIQSLINYFEDILETENKTLIEEANDGYFFIKFPLEWCVSSYAISLFSLLIRVALVYEGGDVMEFLQGYSYNAMDADLLKPSMPKIKKILETKELPPQGDFDIESVRKKRWTPHNLGIVSLK